MPLLEGNEECLVAILKKENEISTRRIIELAQTLELKEFCGGCSDHSDVLAAGNRLVNRGLVARRIKKGVGFVWTLLQGADQVSH